MSAVHKLITDHLAIWTAADTEKKSGRGRASGNANSVYGIKKLRELILELAVRGKLIKPLAEWRDLKLGELGKWAIGSGFPIAEQGVLGEDIFFIKVSDMNLAENEKFISVANNTVSLDSAKRLRLKVHDAGTVIFPKIGGAIATNKRRIITRKTAIDNNCLGLTPRDGVTTKWLFLVLSNIDFSKYQAGTSVPALSQSILQEIPVRCPDTNEQLLVVAKVDELMALCDQLEAQHNNAADAHEQLVSHLLSTLTQSQDAADFNANWHRIATHFDTLFTTESSIDALKQTLLQLAVMGKLVPQDPNDEPASELLKRIQVEKAKLVAERTIKKDKPLATVEMNEGLFDLPQGWEWSVLGQLVLKVSDGPHFSPKYVEKNNGIPFISARNIRIDGWELDSAKYVSFADHEEFSKRTKAKLGDILYTKGGTTGIARVNDLDFEFSVWVHVAVLNLLQSEVHNHYLCLALNSPHCYLQSQKFTHGSSNKDLGLTRMINITVPLPPLNEQKRIVKRVQALIEICDQLKSRVIGAGKIQQRMSDVLVERIVHPATFLRHES